MITHDVAYPSIVLNIKLAHQATPGVSNLLILNLIDAMRETSLFHYIWLWLNKHTRHLEGTLEKNGNYSIDSSKDE